MPVARPNRAVLTVGSTPWFQKVLKKTGKKAARTVVAKEEFAQSYIHQAQTFFL
jgi:hypothetical protein